jgi:hypothetical protein
LPKPIQEKPETGAMGNGGACGVRDGQGWLCVSECIEQDTQLPSETVPTINKRPSNCDNQRREKRGKKRLLVRIVAHGVTREKLDV